MHEIYNNITAAGYTAGQCTITYSYQYSIKNCTSEL